MNKPFPETESVLAVLATAGVFAWRFDSVTGFLAVDEALAVALGVKSGDPRQILRKLTWTDRRHLWAGLKGALQNHKPFEYTVVVNDAADFRRYLKVSGYGSEGVVGVIVDVTSTVESQRREGQWLEKADLWFHLEKSTLALVQWDAEHRIIRWSRRAEEIFGWTEAEVLGQRLEEFSFIFEDDLDRVGSVIATLLDGRSDSSNCYNRNYNKFGRIRYCLWHNSVRRDAEGRITSVLSLADEVSSQVALALNQRDAGEQLRATLENLSEAFMAIDRDEQITYVNKLMVDMLEIPREELIGRRITEIFPLEENELGYSECRRAVTDQVPVEYEQRHIPSNSWISVRAWPSHDQLTIYIRDITVEKNRSEQLRLLESAVATANDMVLITEAEPVTGTGPKIVFVNDAFILHTGYSREEVIGQTPRFLQGRDTDRNDLDRIRAALEKWEPIRAEVVNYTKAGEPFWLEMSIVPIANEVGHFTHWVAIERDITDRKKVEGDLRRVSEQLAESATQYLALFQNGPLPMCVYDLQTLRIVAVNQAAVAHYNYTEAEFLSLSIVDITSPEDQSRLIELAADAHLPGRRVHRLKNIKKGGERIEVEVYTDLIEFAGRPARMVLGHDITEKVIAERELARMTRAKELISRCNEATAQINDETELLQEICRLSHEIGGYNLAWIGYAVDEPGKPIRPVVSAGLMQGYLGRLTVSWDETSIFGQGPAGRAIRTKFPAVIDDFEHDATFRPWVSLATEYGFRSVVGLPLTDRAKNEDRAFGVFVLYSDRSTKITPDEVKLLAELANDIAYGIQNLRSRNEQKRLESALLEVAASVSANSGSEFFRNLVASMTRVTGACAGFAAEIMSKSPNRVRTLAGIERGERLPSVDLNSPGLFHRCWWIVRPSPSHPEDRTCRSATPSLSSRPKRLLVAVYSDRTGWRLAFSIFTSQSRWLGPILRSPRCGFLPLAPPPRWNGKKHSERSRNKRRFLIAHTSPSSSRTWTALFPTGTREANSFTVGPRSRPLAPTMSDCWTMKKNCEWPWSMFEIPGNGRESFIADPRLESLSLWVPAGRLCETTKGNRLRFSASKRISRSGDDWKKEFSGRTGSMPLARLPGALRTT